MSKPRRHRGQKKPRRLSRKKAYIFFYTFALGLGTYNWNRTADLIIDCEFSRIRDEDEIRYAKLESSINEVEETVIELAMPSDPGSGVEKARKDLQIAKAETKKSLENMDLIQGKLRSICSDLEEVAWQSLVYVLIAGGVLTLLTADLGERPEKKKLISRKRAMRLRLGRKKFFD